MALTLLQLQAIVNTNKADSEARDAALVARLVVLEPQVAAFIAGLGSVQAALAVIDALVRGGAVPPPVPTSTLAELIAAAGAVLNLPVGTMKDTAPIPKAMVINGAGMGKTIIDCAGLRPAYQKAVLLPLVPGVKISNLTIMNAAIAAGDGGNAAGVRDEGAQGFELENVEVRGCQNGLLTFAGNYKLTGCKFLGNGSGSGNTHNNYFGGNPLSRVDILNGEYSDAIGGHDVKSRAGTTVMDTLTILKGSDGRAVDIPDAGLAILRNSTIIVAPGSNNGVVIGYGSESQNNRPTGDTLTLSNVFIDNQRGTTYIDGAPGSWAKLVLSNVRIKGAFPELRNWGTVTGSMISA